MKAYSKELEMAIYACKEARKEILKIYHETFEVEIKEDHSPVTLADKHADAIIREILHKAFPNYAFLTEESEDDKSRLTNTYCWIVDPVDGTKDFVNRDDEFTTNIALAVNHHVVLGVIGIPATGEIYYAVKGQGAYYVSPLGEEKRIHVNDKTTDLTMLVSHFHVMQEEIDYFENHKDKFAKKVAIGSSIKACKIACGEAEVQYKFGPGTKEWDTAASQILVEEAGGFYLTPSGEVMKYNRENVYNLDGYIIINRMENFPKL